MVKTKQKEMVLKSYVGRNGVQKNSFYWWEKRSKGKKKRSKKNHHILEAYKYRKKYILQIKINHTRGASMPEEKQNKLKIETNFINK